MNEVVIGKRRIGINHAPLVIAEIGINHEGSLDKAITMVDDALAVGCECVKFQTHIISDEMIPNEVIPGNAEESIWEIVRRCALSEEAERRLKSYVEGRGAIFLSTPFSRAAAYRLEAMGVLAYKIGSGECNNYPLIEVVASFGKPILISTGMNDVTSIKPAVEICKSNGISPILLHCTSVYPTPHNLVRLGALEELRHSFDTELIGLSDHSFGNYACFGATALGAVVLERHFTSDKSWPGPDIPISMDPPELADLLRGVKALFDARGGTKTILNEEKPTIDFAYSCVVSTRPIREGECLTRENIWVKRPGTGGILARHYETLLGKTVNRNLPADIHLDWSDLS